MINEDAALLNRLVTHVTPAALFNRRLHPSVDVWVMPTSVEAEELLLVYAKV